MRLILHQSFPLGRFHATPWRVNPFDDPCGEWPPSPWRLVRAVVARWYQWRRETSEAINLKQLDDLIRALCESSYSFHLPSQALQGRPIRQYQPVEFGWAPPPKKNKPIPRMRTYSTSLVQDNYWSVPCEDEDAVWWFIDGEIWTPDLVEALDRCLERLTYFGRAEAFTRMKRATAQAPQPNCEPRDEASTSASVRVLFPLRDATRADIERTTDDPLSASRTIPPGAKWMHAEIPPRAASRERRFVFTARADCHLIQMAVGWNVAPETRSIVRLTARYRSAVIRELILIKTEGRCRNWSAAPKPVRSAVSDMLGKDAEGSPSKVHHHTEFLSWGESGTPTRLLVWRGARPFDADEQQAILRAAEQEISWAARGQDSDAWKVRLIPLDSAVPHPRGFDGKYETTWRSLTPYVPPRHYLRSGKLRGSESIAAQIRRELRLRGMPESEHVNIEEMREATWVAVHVPARQSQARAFLGDRRGYWLQLTFPTPVAGPLRLGHSSSFGLGLFSPVDPL